jgi:hypothetical protein
MKRKMIAAMFTVGLVVGIGSGVASAAQPSAPGCFGRDRSANIHVMQDGGDPGASEWGHIAADRAGTNGDQNQAYKTSCGGDPS